LRQNGHTHTHTHTLHRERQRGDTSAWTQSHAPSKMTNRIFRTAKRRNISLMGGQTIKMGEACVIFDELGRSKMHYGPKRLWLRGQHTVQFVKKHVANGTQYLVITMQDGSRVHMNGPCHEFQNPAVHKSIEVKKQMQVQEGEAIVVYSEEGEANKKKVTREIVMGPRSFVPRSCEWVQTHEWHGPMGSNPGRHKAKQNKMSRLSLMQQNMEVEVKDVRSSDDCELTVRMIMFYRLTNIEQMLNTTQDPTGDLINAMCADVISRVAESTFETFVERSSELNDLSTFPALTKRAPAIGFEVVKVVYLGYVGNETMQRMHDTSITTRTRQKLQLEKRQQELLLEEYTLNKEQELSEKQRTLTQIQEEHQLALQEVEQAFNTDQELNAANLLREHKKMMDEEQSRKLDVLKENGVDLTRYMVAMKQAENYTGEAIRVVES